MKLNVIIFTYSPGCDWQGGGHQFDIGRTSTHFTKVTLIYYILWIWKAYRLPLHSNFWFLTFYRGYKTANIEICIKTYGAAKMSYFLIKSLNPWFYRYWPNFSFKWCEILWNFIKNKILAILVFPDLPHGENASFLHFYEKRTKINKAKSG